MATATPNRPTAIPSLDGRKLVIKVPPNRLAWRDSTWIGIVTALTLAMAVGVWSYVHGCQSAVTQPPPEQTIAQIGTTVGSEVPVLRTAGNAVGTEADAIAAKTPPANLPKIQPNLTSLQVQKAAILGSADRLSVVPAQAQAATTQVVAVEKDDADQKVKAASSLTHLLPLVIFVGVAGLIASGVLFYLSGTSTALAPLKTIAVCLLIGSGIGIATAILLDQHVALIGDLTITVVLLGAVAAVVYELKLHKVLSATTLATVKADGEKALTEVVQTAEAAKQELLKHAPASVVKLFGDGAIVGGVADSTQSPATKTAVAAIRATPAFRVAKVTPAPTVTPGAATLATPAVPVGPWVYNASSAAPASAVAPLAQGMPVAGPTT
jgi:hypothetical protein